MEGTMKVTGVTIAVTDMPLMVAFYDAVFEAKLQPLDAYSMTLYQGKLADLDLLLCPNEIASVEAKQNRQQLRVAVASLAEVEARVKDAGGHIINQQDMAFGVRDPDGNTLEFVQQ
jgi:predicted enzyme related to lactoylglutathione lyase